MGCGDGNGRPDQPELRQRPPAERKPAAQHGMEQRPGAEPDSRRGHVAGAADRGGKQVGDPHGNAAGEDDDGVVDGAVQHGAGAAERREDRPREQAEQQQIEQRHDRGDDRAVAHQGVGPVPVAGAERPRDRRGDRAAHGAGRHHLHHRMDGEDQGDRCQRQDA